MSTSVHRYTSASVGHRCGEKRVRGIVRGRMGEGRRLRFAFSKLCDIIPKSAFCPQLTLPRKLRHTHSSSGCVVHSASRGVSRQRAGSAANPAFEATCKLTQRSHSEHICMHTQPWSNMISCLGPIRQIEYSWCAYGLNPTLSL